MTWEGSGSGQIGRIRIWGSGSGKIDRIRNTTKIGNWIWSINYLQLLLKKNSWEIYRYRTCTSNDAIYFPDQGPDRIQIQCMVHNPKR